MAPHGKDTPKREGTRRTNAIANSIRIFRGLEGLGELSYLAPLKPICGLAIAILELAQTLRKLRDDHTELIDRIERLALILDPVKHETGARVMIAEVGDLERALQEIVNTLERECQLGWFQRMCRTQELKESIVSCTAKVNAYIECFTVASLLRIQNMLLEDKAEVPFSSSFPSYLAYSFGSNFQQIQTFKDNHVILDQSFLSLPDATLFRGHITRSHSDLRVVVKRYKENDTAKQAFKMDVELLKGLRHPNLHQLMGTSVPTAKLPFIIIPEFESGGVTNFLNRRLTGDGVDSFMATLRVCQGIASGIEYLRKQCTGLHQSELEVCFQPSNIVLTPSGQPIIGHNLVLDAPPLTPQEMPSILDAWLKNQFLSFVNSITYGTLDLSDWNLLMARKEGRRASHLRLLEHFTSFAIPSFTHATLLFDSLLDALEHAHRRGELSFPTIRAAAVGLWSGAFVYRPKTPIQCTVGDIGYMRDDGRFVVLTNVSDLVAGGVVEDVSVLLRATSGDPVIRSSSDVCGIITHRFGKTLFASIRRRRLWAKFTSSHPAWLYFIPSAKTICDTFSSVEVPLRVDDLIFIVGVEEDLRISIFDRKGAPDEAPFEVEFLEIEDPLEGASWGEWHTENRENACITHTRCPQSLLFIQLEEEDVE